MPVPSTVDRDLLLADVIRRPLDDTAKLIYADWLEEYGEGLERDRAQLIRTMVTNKLWASWRVVERPSSSAHHPRWDLGSENGPGWNGWTGARIMATLGHDLKELTLLIPANAFLVEGGFITGVNVLGVSLLSTPRVMMGNPDTPFPRLRALCRALPLLSICLTELADYAKGPRLVSDPPRFVWDIQDGGRAFSGAGSRIPIEVYNHLLPWEMFSLFEAHANLSRALVNTGRDLADLPLLPAPQHPTRFPGGDYLRRLQIFVRDDL